MFPLLSVTTLLSQLYRILLYCVCCMVFPLLSVTTLLSQLYRILLYCVCCMVFPLLSVTTLLSQLYRILLYCVCCMVTLVPQKLLEFRYFILPYLLLRLHMPQGSRLSLVAELLLYSAVNGLTIWLFLYRPFHWPDSQNQQRFMW